MNRNPDHFCVKSDEALGLLIISFSVVLHEFALLNFDEEPMLDLQRHRVQHVHIELVLPEAPLKHPNLRIQVELWLA